MDIIFRSVLVLKSLNSEKIHTGQRKCVLYVFVCQLAMQDYDQSLYGQVLATTANGFEGAPAEHWKAALEPIASETNRSTEITVP